MQPNFEVAYVALLILLAVGSLGIWSLVLRGRREGQQLVEQEPHAMVPWSGWDVAAVVLMFLILESVAVKKMIEKGSEQLSVSGLATLTTAHVLWFAFAVPYLGFRSGATMSDLGLKPAKLLYDVRLGLITFAAAALPVYGVQIALTQFVGPTEHPLVKFAKDESTVGALALATLSAVLVAPLVEEFLFRVILQGWLEKRTQIARQERGLEGPGLGPIVVVSMVFAAMHYGNGPDPVALFILALFLGYLYQQTHRIFAPLVVHVCVNALAVIELWVALFGNK